jgi:hypothetical protein
MEIESSEGVSLHPNGRPVQHSIFANRFGANVPLYGFENPFLRLHGRAQVSIGGIQSTQKKHVGFELRERHNTLRCFLAPGLVDWLCKL